MRRPSAAVGSAAFFVVGPGTVVGLVPWLITGWQFHQPWPWWTAAQVAGAALVCVGLVPLARAFVAFVRADGTPMPVAAPEHLVVDGPNRYVRNPMYVGILVAILGQALLFGSPGVLLYALASWALTASFVHWYEEPALTRRFGAEYEAYRGAVPAWIPRTRPWSPHE